MNKKPWTCIQSGIEWAIKLAEQHGRKVATADEAPQVLKDGVWYDGVEDTLFNLGLPPNRAAGKHGFLAYERQRRQAPQGGRGTHQFREHSLAAHRDCLPEPAMRSGRRLTSPGSSMPQIIEIPKAPWYSGVAQ